MMPPRYRTMNHNHACALDILLTIGHGDLSIDGHRCLKNKWDGVS